MTEFVPQDKNYLPADIANDEDYEIIFVQHGPQFTTQQIVDAYTNGQNKDITITELEDQAPVYPVSFGNGDLSVFRKVDKYVIATPSH